MSWWNNVSLKTKLITMSVGMLLIVAGVSIFFTQRIFHSGREMYAMAYESLAEEASKAIQAQFYERYGDIQAFAANSGVMALDAKRAEPALDFYAGLYGIYDLILVVDAQGKFVASNTKEPSGNPVNQQRLSQMDYSKEKWFQSVMKGQFTSEIQDGLNGTFVEPYLVDTIQEVAFGQRRYGTGFSAPVKDANGKVIGVITNRANAKWIESVFTEMYQSFADKGAKSGNFLLLDGEGFVLVEHDPNNNGYKNEIVRNEELIFKFNPSKAGAQFGKDLLEGKGGHGYLRNARTDELMVTGYAPVKGSKFVDSIGWGVVVSADEAEVMAAMNRDIQSIWLGFGILSLVATFVAFWFSTSISKSVMARVSELLKASNEVTDASTKIASQSTELSEAATEQAAAIQETMSAVDEISATTEKNAESAHRSKTVSGQSRESATRGQREMDQMLKSIADISSSNDEIAQHMQESNRQISDIVRLINDIGSKTKVINEIVFQTKLLSFNASVEAARAGEYGKGFAVVAEEVGNLAQMSGNAAKEISEMLEGSIRQVEKIVADTQSKIENLVDNSKEKVALGNKTAEQCNDALADILKNVAEVDALVSEIAQASREQSNGVREISKAIGQLDVVTQQNTAVSQQSSAAAEQLNAQAVELNGIVGELTRIVEGTSKDSNHPGRGGLEPKQAKVLQMKKSSGHVRSAEVTKKASGHDIEVPSSNDPRFEDV
ncbi:MAG: methyl-accepting chemotaxis protein [Pseudobdellovibrionaceae bacterium]